MKVSRVPGDACLYVAVDFAFGKAVQYAVEETLRLQASPGINRRAIGAEVRRRLEQKIAREHVA